MAGKAPKNVAPSSDRPYAESPAPESIRVDLCTARAEWLKQREPDAPQPVFSTMALVHGSEMVTARRVVEGFSFNPQMDLLWAAGFPEVAFIMDGLPLVDSRESLLELHNRPGEKKKLWKSVQLELGRIYTRRGAFARVFECNGEYMHALKLDTEAEFLEATAPRELSYDDLSRVLTLSGDVDNDALLLEALVGPERVCDVALGIVEEGKPTARGPYYVLSAIGPLARRLRAEAAAKVAKRAQSILAGTTDSSISAAARELVNASDWTRDLPEYCARFFSPELVGDWDYEGDMNDAYLTALSSIRSAAMLPGLLLVGARKDAKDVAAAWLRARGSAFATELTALAGEPDSPYARLAKQALKLL